MSLRLLMDGTDGFSSFETKYTCIPTSLVHRLLRLHILAYLPDRSMLFRANVLAYTSQLPTNTRLWPIFFRRILRCSRLESIGIAAAKRLTGAKSTAARYCEPYKRSADLIRAMSLALDFARSPQRQ
jgi:hypothetical protein